MTSKTPRHDKRSAFRLDLILRVEYLDRKQYLASWTENVSAGGLFIQTDESFQPGDAIHAVISFPGLLQPIEIDGTIAWIRPSSSEQRGGVGVQVKSDSQRRRLADLALACSPGAEETPIGPFRVLVVGDNPHAKDGYRQVLQHIAKKSGGNVTTVFADNGQDAQRLVEADTPDFVITDLYMPVMDGFTLIRQLRANEATAKIMVLAIAAGATDEEQRARQAGADAFLRKPIQFGQLLETIVCLLKLKKSNQ